MVSGSNGRTSVPAGRQLRKKVTGHAEAIHSRQNCSRSVFPFWAFETRGVYDGQGGTDLDLPARFGTEFTRHAMGMCNTTSSGWEYIAAVQLAFVLTMLSNPSRPDSKAR